MIRPDATTVRRAAALDESHALLERLARRFRPIPTFASDHPEHAGWLAEQIWGGEYDEPGFIPRRGWQVLDIGANVGTFAQLAAARGAFVAAFEPHPGTHRYLVENTNRRVRAVQAAVVAHTPPDRTVRLHLGDEDTRHSLLTADQGSGVELDGSFIDVPAVEMRELLDRRWDLVKMDCEGSEFEIFDSLDRDRLLQMRRLTIELHGGDDRRAAFCGRLAVAGFRVKLRRLTEPNLALCFAGRVD